LHFHRSPLTVAAVSCDAPPANDPSRGARLREVALLFTRLGFTAFGGPAAHLAIIEDEVVRRRNWLPRERFLDLVALVNFIPGPNSTELAIHLGLIRAGFPGLVVAGACFILPAVLIILPLGYAYVHFGRLAWVAAAMAAINAAVVAVLAVACWRFARSAVKDRFAGVVALVATLAAFASHWRQVPQSELMILAAAAAAGAAREARSLRRGAPDGLTLPALLAAAPAATQAAVGAITLGGMGWFFLKVGATLFGSGYVIVSYLDAGLVQQRGWLTRGQLLDSVAVGQVTPGPLLTTATFAGYVMGYKAYGSDGGALAGALVSTACIFLPAFVFVALLGNVLPRLRQSAAARGALDAASAAVVALIVVVTVDLAWASLRDPVSLSLATGAAVALLAWNVNATWVMLAAAAIGVARGLWR
jgi:chromate transporter